MGCGALAVGVWLLGPLNTIKQTNKQSNLGQNREVSHTQVHLTRTRGKKSPANFII
jgi:hypothetical protein